MFCEPGQSRTRINATGRRIEEEQMNTEGLSLAIVTGASTGIGFELAKQCGEHKCNLIVVADEPAIESAAQELRKLGVTVEAVQADLATAEGVDALCQTVGGRPVDALLANAGRGLGKSFFDQDFAAIRRVIDTNVTGTLYLIHRIGSDMRARGRGRILVTGSIAGYMPGSFQAVYNGTKALLDSFAAAVRNELKDSGVSVTCLMPGPTETEFFKRAFLQDTKVGTDKKQSPSEVARLGFEAMMRGEAEVVTGWKNKLQVALAHLVPTSILAEQHRRMAQPGTAKSR